MKAHFLLTALVVAATIPAVQAQQPAAKISEPVVSSEPGKAGVLVTAEVSATVTAVDKATRTITLKGPQRTVEVVAGDAVKNFDQIKVGDSVAVKYVEALTLELKKTKAPVDAKGEVAAVRAAPGARPAGAIGREITLRADVVDVDPKNSTISLKGPRGNVVDLKVQNQDHFKVVKKGDQVEVVYTEAVALAVTPASQPSPKK